VEFVARRTRLASALMDRSGAGAREIATLYDGHVTGALVIAAARRQ